MKLISIPPLTSAQLDALLDAIAAACDFLGSGDDPAAVFRFRCLSERLESDQNGFTSGEIDNMCYALDIRISQLQHYVNAPLFSSQDHAAASAALQISQSVRALLLPLVPGHQHIHIPE